MPLTLLINFGVLGQVAFILVDDVHDVGEELGVARGSGVVGGFVVGVVQVILEGHIVAYHYTVTLAPEFQK